MFKKRYLFLIILLCFFTISVVSAEEICYEMNIMPNNNDLSLMAESVDECTLSLCDEEIQGSADNGTFSALQKKINDAPEGSEINLKNNYTYDEGFENGIRIDKPLTINGNGYTMDGKNIARILGINSNVTLKNINFINGNIDNRGDGGGAIAIGDNGNLEVNCCSFINNNASSENWFGGYGGAIYVSGNITLVDSNFVNNYAIHDGGAIYLAFRTNATIINCIFENNSADNGGAIFQSFQGNSVATNCNFINNSAWGGGAICSQPVWGAFIVKNSHFINNTAIDGGAIKGGNIFSNLSFINNTAIKGGAIHWLEYYGNMTNCSFLYNYADNGGAIYILGTRNNIFSNLSFINNTAINGGAIYSQINLDELIIKNSFFIYNYGDNGTSIYILEHGSGFGPKIFDSYFYTNKNKELIYYTKYVSLSHYENSGTLFLKNNTMISPSSYKIYMDTCPDRIYSKKYLILENETCYINKPFPIMYTDDNGNKIRLNKDIPITLTDSKNNLSFEINATFDSASGLYYIFCNREGIYNLSVDANFSRNLTIVPTILEVHLAKPNLYIHVDNRSYGENTTFIVKVTLGDYLVDEGNISFYIDDKKVGSANVSNGLATFNYTYLNVGTFNIFVIYEENDNYLSNNLTTSFTVKKVPIVLYAPDLIKYYKGLEKFVVTVKDKNNKSVVGVEVKIILNGKPYTKTTDSNGQASMAINLNSGVYNVTSKYEDIKVDSKITVKSTVLGSDVTKIFRNGTQYYATFVDTKGNLMKNTDVKFNINGVFYTRTTNDHGVAKMNINLPPQTYIITAENLNSTEKYTNVITVLPSIVENYNLTKYYKNASKYTLRILASNGKSVGEGVEVKLNINGIFYTRTTNASGYINLNINLPPGTYTVTAEYNGLRASNIIKVLSVLETHDLSMKYKDGSKFEAKILDGQGKPYVGQNVSFNINGVFYQKVADDDGVARLTINLIAGEYIITSSYNGLNAANKVTISS